MTATEQVIATNRRAYHDYYIEESIEAGLVLTGTEIKSIRERRVNLRDSYARVEGHELWLWNAHIAPYPSASHFNHDPIRTRKLLLHRRQIGYLAAKVKEKGYTLIPLRLYIKDGYAKIEIGLGKGKTLYDKREAIASKEARLQIQRALKTDFKKSK
ncbi:MAG: SsrA-binding protein SmpB [Chloroflexi bacterium]|nr:SsrA-binding protein SmpB [Chloroflexota bacterium]